MELILTMAIMGAVCIMCFYVGAKVGQTASKGQTIHVPVKSPVQLYHEHEERREVEREKDRLDTIMGNIERYDGTSCGQKEIPR